MPMRAPAPPDQRASGTKNPQDQRSPGVAAEIPWVVIDAQNYFVSRLADPLGAQVSTPGVFLPGRPGLPRRATAHECYFCTLSGVHIIIVHEQTGPLIRQRNHFLSLDCPCTRLNCGHVILDRVRILLSRFPPPLSTTALSCAGAAHGLTGWEPRRGATEAIRAELAPFGQGLYEYWCAGFCQRATSSGLGGSLAF